MQCCLSTAHPRAHQMFQLNMNSRLLIAAVLCFAFQQDSDVNQVKDKNSQFSYTDASAVMKIFQEVQKFISSQRLPFLLFSPSAVMLPACTEKPSGVHRSYSQIHTNMSGYGSHMLGKKKLVTLKQKQHSMAAKGIIHQDPEKEQTFPMSGSCLKRKASHTSQSHGEEHTQPWTLDFIDYIFLCSVSPSLSFSSATELTLAVFQCTSLHSLLNPSSTYTEFFSLHATVSLSSCHLDLLSTHI